MAALVQTYSQQTGSVTMLQTRPGNNNTMMQPSQSHQNHQLISGAGQAPRGAYGAVPSPTGYRGSSAPVQQYAFTATPSLNQVAQWQPYGGYRTNVPQNNTVTHPYDNNAALRGRFPAYQGMQQNAYGHPMHMAPGTSRDDSSIPTARNIVPQPRPQSAYLAAAQTGYSNTQLGKNTPDRYRRPALQSAQHGRSQSSTALPSNPAPEAAAALPSRPLSFYATVPGTSKDDSHLHLPSNSEDSRRLRRRSMHTLDQTLDFNQSFEIAPLGEGFAVPKSPVKDTKTLRPYSNSPTHGRNGSSESVNSSRSSHSRPSSANNRHGPKSPGTSSLSTADESHSKQETTKAVNVPTRGSSSDAMKRTLNPSPLSRPVTMGGEGSDTKSSSAARPASPAVNSNLNSPAAKQLAAINQNGGKTKSKTSRLRRAFSFGSAAELRRAAAGDGDVGDKQEPSKLQKNPTSDEAYDAEQARIAEQQEAAGIGNSIYGGRFFGGSTDNLSISSTASSASIMIRKMGRGVKKGGRSLAGLFRPKSVIGVPAAEPLAPEASQAAVSMITVEAETQRVNVNPEPNSSGGGTDFPHLERNSIDAAAVPEMISERAGSSGTDSSTARKSIVGGDRERAEVLAAVRKGILKRSGSPSSKAASPTVELGPPQIPAVTDSPNSSAPSTPNDEAQGHRRTGSIAIGNEDYFMTALRLRQDTKSAPVTPQGGTKRNATFSPRIVFHDTWPPQEYDRRGEIATCNRLTPMLAQQIKEELNTFKMEMEVHENSKIYTHFF